MLLKKVFSFSLLWTFSVFLFSCDVMNNSMAAFFKEYTENAAIEKMVINGEFPKNPSGITCLSCDEDVSIDFFMRNPQKYRLNFTYDFEDSDAQAALATYPISYVQSGDRNSVRFTLPRDFLKAVDLSSKQLSGKITLTEPSTGRKFADYPVTLHANTVPPAVENACFQLSASNGGTYIICFYLPNVNPSIDSTDMSLHTNDTKKIIINGMTRYFKGGTIYRTYPDGIVISSPDPDFEYTAPSGMTVNEKGYDFTSSVRPKGYSAVYYKSGINQSTSPVPMSITIEDDDGLASTVNISNQAEQLTPPLIADITDLKAGVQVGEITGTHDVVISHNGLTTNGNSCGSVNISYKVYTIDGSTLVKSGTASGSARIALPKGKYKVTAKASKAYYISSEEYDSSAAGEAPSPNGIWLKPSIIFYVAQSGSNDVDGGLGNGSSSKPLRTIQKAIDIFNETITAGEFEETDICTIRVMSNLTPDVSDTFGTGNNNALADFKNNRNYLLEGYNGNKFTLDAEGSVLQPDRRVINCSPDVKLTISNLSLTGGYINKGAGLYSAANVSCNANIVLNNVTVRNNTATGDGGGAVFLTCNQGCSQTLELNNCLLEENTAKVGSAVYFNSGYNNNTTLTLYSCTIQKNHSVGGGTAGAGTIYLTDQLPGANGTTYLKGNTVIQNNDSETIGAAISFSTNLVIDSPNVVIKGNVSSNGKNVYANSSDAVIKLNYPVYIYNNLDSNDKQANVYLYGSTQAALKKINIGGNISRSTIGIGTECQPVIGTPVIFTAGFASNNAVSSGSVFISDSPDYGVIDSASGEGSLSTSGGSMLDAITSQKITFSCSDYNDSTETPKALIYYPGYERTISFTPTLTVNETEQSSVSELWSGVTWRTWITCDGETVPGTSTNGSDYTDSITVPDTFIYEEAYMVNVKFTFNGISYDDQWPLVGKKDISILPQAPSSGTFSISSKENLKTIKEWLSSGTGQYLNFELTDDIVAANDSSVGNIGTESYPYKGHFDGKGHKISDLAITNAGTDATGLFSYTNNATIENLTIIGTVTSTNANYTGGFVGEAKNTTIKNCVNKADVTNSKDSSHAAGIAGFCNNLYPSTIDGCINEGNITGYKFAAGIIGAGGNNGTVIRNCGNKGNIRATMTGGFAGGICPQQYASIYNCYNTGDITAHTGSNEGNGGAGGIAATSGSGKIISNCFSNGKIDNLSGLKIGGNIAGSSISTSCVNNYFTYPASSSVTTGEGTVRPDVYSAQTVAPRSYQCLIQWDSFATIPSNITIGSVSTNDVKDLLNAWIDIQDDPSIYRKWTYQSGNPVLMEQ